jgi:membrane dipeptidase
MAIVVDAHSDILNDIHPRRLAAERGVLEKFWLPKMKEGKIDIRVVAIYSEPQYLPELALRRALDLVATLYQELEESPSSVLCTSGSEVRQAKASGKTGFILGMEGAEPLGSDLQLLPVFHKLGLRILGFTHALRTYLADGAFISGKRAGQVGGLTNVGLDFLELAQSMGILIDVSHLNDPSFWDVMKFTKAPVIASHSNCRALASHPRNLTDEQIKAVAASGGVVGVNACSLFVEPPDLGHLVDHIEHLAKVGGREHVGLGPDFADYLLTYMSEAEKIELGGPIQPVQGLPGDESVPRIADELAKRGTNQKDIDLIMGENFARVFDEVLKT